MLEGTPEAAYYSAAPFGTRATSANPWGASQFGPQGEAGQGGYSPIAQQYWAGQFGNVRSQYLGEVGRSLKSQQDPMSFTEYLDQYPFMQRYSSLGPAMRPGGSGASRYSPRTRYMY